MSVYSKALRHVDSKDFRRTRQRHLDEQKILCKIEREQQLQERKEVEEIKRLAFPFKSAWRKELNEGMTSSGLFFTTLSPPVNTYDNPVVTSSTATISYLNAINSSTRLITLGTFDVSTIDQFEVNATRLGSGGSSYGWALQANGTVIAAGGENDPIRVANASELALFKSGKVTFTIRQSTIPAFGDNATSPSVTGWTIDNVKFYRTVPVNVFVPLDSPEASAFIRTSPILSNLSPQERLQKLKEMLQASDEYVMKILGTDFPGTGATPPGESSTIPGVEITDYQSSSNYQSSVIKSFVNMVKGKEPAFAVGFIEGLTTAEQSEVLKSLGPKATATFNQLQQYKELNKKLSQSRNPSDWDKAQFQVAPAISDLYTKFGKEMKGELSQPLTPPQQINNKQDQEKQNRIDRELEKLKADQEKIKSDQVKRNWELAAQIGMDLATAAAFLTPLPGDEAAVLATRAASSAVDDAAAAFAARAAKASAEKAARRSAERTAKFKSDMDALRNQRPSGGRINNTSLLDSYESQGNLISEKKKLKSPDQILKQIPGYYDGKPAPLGFPETPPPEMINGMHPDLVDGKKVADRFNRLDSVSANAMPLTGNPHIDKKILKARKQPK